MEISRGEGRRLATKGTKSTKGRTTDLDLPFVLFVPFVANLLPSPWDTVWATAPSARVCPGLWTQCSESERGLKPATTCLSAAQNTIFSASWICRGELLVAVILPTLPLGETPDVGSFGFAAARFALKTLPLGFWNDGWFRMLNASARN